MKKSITDVNPNNYELHTWGGKTLFINAVEDALKDTTQYNHRRLSFLLADEIINLLNDYDRITYSTKEIKDSFNRGKQAKQKEIDLLNIQLEKNVTEEEAGVIYYNLKAQKLNAGLEA